ncbi:LPP20 family lipoprotein [bacterium]|nr:LPP20 family lipoprotein [bacterium]
MKRLILAAVLLSLVFVFAGCGGGPKPMSDIVSNELDGAPDWVINGRGDNDKMIYGVGSAGGSKNVALMRSTALGRGRTEIAHQLDLKVKSMLKDYQSTTTGGEYFGEAANDEQHIEDVSKQVTDLSLSGTRQEETWISKTGTLYVLVSLDIEAFKDIVNGMTHLSEQVRKAVVERADKAFAELDAE